VADEEVVLPPLPVLDRSVRAPRAVTAPGIYEQVEHLVRFDERVDDLHRRGGIDVHVELADDEQHLSLQLRRVVHVR
jgi:hypothetical protein